MLTIVDVGLGNVTSVSNILDRLGHKVELRPSPEGLSETDRYVLPGVGTRERALELFSEPLHEEDELRRDRQCLCCKLRISDTGFDDIVNRPIRHYTDFDNWDKQHERMKAAQTRVSRVLGRDISAYR